MEWHEKTQLERIEDRWDEKEAAYARRETALEPICNFFRPDLGVDFDAEADMLMLGGDIYEGSGPWVARKASTAFQGHTVRKDLDWLQHGFSDPRLVGIDELDLHIQNMKEHNASVYQNGNFYDTQPQFTLDGWTIGSPLSFIEEDPDTNNVMCMPAHWKTYRIFYDKYNRSEGVIVKDKWDAKKCFDKFCPGADFEKRKEKAEKIFSISLFNAIKNGQYNERFPIWRAVFKSIDPIWKGKNLTSPAKMTWYDVYFEDTGLKEKQDTPLLASGYWSRPFVHWDFDKKPWESISRTPSFSAIYDNVAMQQIFKNYIENVQLKVRPAMAVLMGTEGRNDFSSEGLNYLNLNEWQYKPTPIEQVGDVNLETDLVKILRENLSRHFSLDAFQLFTDLAREKGKDFRVLQLIEMAGEKITVLLPMIESHEHYLEMVDSRVRDIETKAGRGPYNKRELENVYDILDYYLGDDAWKVKIVPQFIGTLRKEQQRAQNLKPLHLGMGALAEFGEMMGDPDYVSNMIKKYEVGDKTLRATSFPQNLVKEKEDYEAEVAARAEANANQIQFENQVEMVKAMKGMPQAQLTGQTA